MLSFFSLFIFFPRYGLLSVVGLNLYKQTMGSVMEKVDRTGRSFSAH